MKVWRDDLLSRMQCASSAEALFDAARAEAQKLGFDHCAYGLRLPWNITKPKTVMLNNYPPGWQQQYVAENYLAIDPTVRHGCRSVLPLVWSEDVFREAPEFWEDARAYGLRYGWAQPCVDMQGFLGMLTLSRGAEPLSEAELKENGYRMTWLTQALHQSMSGLISTKQHPNPAAIQLSLREKEVLRWTAEGKTSGEIAHIMNITERTVNFHISNVMAKLDCVNKTAAAVRATRLGLLY